MPNFTVNLRKRELGDSFEMVIDPFMFNMEMTALADVANALIDTGATKTGIGLDVVKKLQLQPIRTEQLTQRHLAMKKWGFISYSCL